jgi:hypothetical protein
MTVITNPVQEIVFKPFEFYSLGFGAFFLNSGDTKEKD